MAEPRMLVIYASTHGQAETIALRIAETASLDAVIRDIDHASTEDLENCDAVVIVASVHFGKHPRSVRNFVRENRERLSQLHTAFVSISDSAGQHSIERFEAQTGWMPEQVQRVARAMDTHRDYEFTDWGEVERFARSFSGVRKQTT